MLWKAELVLILGNNSNHKSYNFEFLEAGSQHSARKCNLKVPLLILQW